MLSLCSSLQFRGQTVRVVRVRMAETEQSSRLITFIFYYLAIGTLLPWNFFINVSDYWMYKFRTVRNVTGANTTLGLTADLNPLQLEFMSDLANAAMIPNVMFLVLNGVVGHRFRMDRRCCSRNI